MNKSTMFNRLPPHQAAFNRLAKRHPHWFRIDHCQPVRHHFLPFGQQATLLYDASYPLLQRLASYEQSQFELTGKAPDYCYQELNLPQNHEELLRDIRCDILLHEQTYNLRRSQRHHYHSEPHPSTTEPLHILSLQLLAQDPTSPVTPFQATVMQATIPSPSSDEMPEDIKKQTPLEHVNSIPDSHLPDDSVKAQEVRDILLQHTKALSLYKFDIGFVDPAVHGYARIETGDASPHFEPPRRFSHLERQALHARVREYRYSDICGDSISPWASNPLMVPKKDTDRTVDDYRLCVDLRGLNNATVADRHPLPRIEDLTATVRGCRWLTTLDLKSAFNSYQIHPDDRAKTAFYAGDYGLQQFNRLTMGLQNAPAIWQRLIESIFADCMGTSGDNASDFKAFCKIYLDDIIIYSKTWEEHKKHISLVMHRLQQAGLKLNADKAYFGQRDVMYCGFIISGDSTRPNPKLCTAITEYPKPKDLKQVMSFLGMVNFFRFYIEKFADIAAPLHALTKQPYNKRKPPDIQALWTTEHDQAFEGLKQALISEPVLAQPDFTKPFTLHTDASGAALGAVLTQDDDAGHPRAIGYASRTLTDVETRYSATETECLAVIWACEAFRHYLHGHHFSLFSDHQALHFLMGGGASRSTNRKHHRWLAELQSYNFTICHRPGVDNVVPDALSRCYSLQASDRQAYLAALLVATLEALDYTVCHRPISIAGFSVTTDPDDETMPHASPATLAACLAGAHSPTTAATDLEDVTTADGPQELAAILAAPLAVAPSTEIHANTVILVPDPSRFRHTSHDTWTRYLDFYTPVPLPHHDTAYIAVTRHSHRPSRPSHPQVLLPAIDATTTPLPSTKPIHCMELCGGLGIFLEALLRNGYNIARYTYVDNDPVARSAMAHRLDCLHCRYPRQLPASAYQHHLSLPQDVHCITPDHLATLPPVDLFAAGPPCQSFSKAGARRGWTGSTSRVFPAVLHILHHLQQSQSLTYIIENVPAASSDFPELTAALGPCVHGDAVNHGSAAHRRTVFWTNMALNTTLQQHLDTPSVTTRWNARAFLRDMGCNDWHPHANTPEFFNKFVRTHGSHAHRQQPDGSPGPSQLIFRGRPVELPPVLREAAMGFDPWTTMPPGITAREQHQLLGNAIDINLATRLLHAPTTRSTCCGSCLLHQPCQFDGLCECVLCAATQLTDNPVQVDAVSTDPIQQQWHDAQCLICKDVAGEDNMVECDTCGLTVHLRCLSPPRHTPPSGIFCCPACDPHGISATQELYMPHTPLQYRDKDPYMDIELLDYVFEGQEPYRHTPRELTTFQRQAACYRQHPTQTQWLQIRKGQIQRWRTVPPKEYRLDIIRVFHDALAHAGSKNTLSNLSQYFTWIGIAHDVAEYVKCCDTCQRKNRMQLLKDPQPFDLYGPFEHVLMDSCGPFYVPNPAYASHVAASGKKRSSTSPAPDKNVKAWVIVIVDYFTKVAEFGVVADHSSATVAAAAYDAWISRYPKPKKWTTDQGTENKGAFTAMLHRLGIPHITTAVFNPTANGACERLVGTLKRMLAKMIGHHETSWPTVLPHVRAAYMRRIHRATGFSPMQMLTGFTADPLLPLGDLLSTATLQALSLSTSATAAARLASVTLSAAATHRRTEIDVVTPYDSAWMHTYSTVNAATLSAELADELATLDRDLQLDDLTNSILNSNKHMHSADLAREEIYRQARVRLSQHQLQNRERYLKLLRSRPNQQVFEVRAGDLVLIHNQDDKGLRLPLIGPFQVVRNTGKGNVIIQSRNTSNTDAPPQWSVASDRVYPYRFAHQCYDVAP